MNNIFKVSLLAAAVALTVGCNDAKKDEAMTQESMTATQESTFATSQDKAAYAIGASFSRYVETTLEKQAEFGLVLDKELIIQGISDTLRGSPKLTNEEMIATLKEYDATVQAAAKKAMAEKATKSAEEAKVYLDANAKKEGVMVTESGLQYSVVTKAEGAKPTAEDTVTVHYTGTLIDGTVFDSSVERGKPATFPLKHVIPGWTEGLQLMSVGEKFIFVIPANLAYGNQAAGKIPAGSTLTFEVELLSIAEKAKTKAPAKK